MKNYKFKNFNEAEVSFLFATLTRHWYAGVSVNESTTHQFSILF
jgi:hypothetical protein